jgi:carboxylesterase type B
MKTFLGLQPFVALYGCCALNQNTIDIKLQTGTFRGLSTSNGTEKWLGIPFALPPVGQLRFKAPIPITKASNSIMDASTFGNACPQPAATLGAPIAEDCLFLNVKIQSSFSNILKPIPPQIWRPQGLKEGAKLPVLFWIHVGTLFELFAKADDS